MAGRQILAIRGHGVFSDSVNVLTGEIQPHSVRPSAASDMLHGFGCISRFLPVGKALTAAVEERLWDRLYANGPGKEVVLFEDQYISTGGQFCELLSGHDRMDGPLDTTSPISWVGYANPTLADHIRPVLRAVLKEMLDA